MLRSERRAVLPEARVMFHAPSLGVCERGAIRDAALRLGPPRALRKEAALVSEVVHLAPSPRMDRLTAIFNAALFHRRAAIPHCERSGRCGNDLRRTASRPFDVSLRARACGSREPCQDRASASPDNQDPARGQRGFEMKRLCAVPGCKKIHVARGLCDTHRKRATRHGRMVCDIARRDLREVTQKVT